MYEDTFQWAKSEARGTEYCRNFLIELKYSYLWFKKFKIKRRTITTINRLRSKHISFRASLYRFRIIDLSMCSQCNMETLNHVFWECIEYVDQRKTL